MDQGEFPLTSLPLSSLGLRNPRFSLARRGSLNHDRTSPFSLGPSGGIRAVSCSISGSTSLFLPFPLLPLGTSFPNPLQRKISPPVLAWLPFTLIRCGFSFFFLEEIDLQTRFLAPLRDAYRFDFTSYLTFLFLSPSYVSNSSSVPSVLDRVSSPASHPRRQSF